MSADAVSPISTYFRVCDGVRVRFAANRADSDITMLLLAPWPESLWAFRRIWRRVAAIGREAAIDPPGPNPSRCFDIGAAVARVLADSPWRVALIASSSWSHAFLTAKHHWLYPDVTSDRARFDELAFDVVVS